MHGASHPAPPHEAQTTAHCVLLCGVAGAVALPAQATARACWWSCCQIVPVAPGRLMHQLLRRFHCSCCGCVQLHCLLLLLLCGCRVHCLAPGLPCGVLHALRQLLCLLAAWHLGGRASPAQAAAAPGVLRQVTWTGSACITLGVPEGSCSCSVCCCLALLWAACHVVPMLCAVLCCCCCCAYLCDELC
jgi:hypothetical protein